MRAMTTIDGAEITPPGNGPRHRAAANDSGTAQDRYSTAIGFLRAFVTVLVVAHHAVLAYVEFAPAATLTSLVPEPRWWQALPVVDGQRWAGFALFVSFNDTFFMALMFFLSGLFTWSSLTKKGTGRFLHDRWLRLGVPFVIAAAVLAPVAYSTAYLTRTQAPTVAGFWQQWLALGTWPAGPAWFLWVLLALDLVAAAVFAVTGGRGLLPARAWSASAHVRSCASRSSRRRPRWLTCRSSWCSGPCTG